MLTAMVGLQKKARKQRVLSSARLQAVRTYLLAILAFSLVLFSLSLVALVSQQQAVQELSLTNLRFDGERVADDIDAKAMNAAKGCLAAENLKNLTYRPDDERSPQKMRALRKAFAALKKGHPIADHFFIWSGGKFVFPVVTAPETEKIEDMVKGEAPSVASQFVALIAAARREENGRDKQHQNAVRLYRRAQSLPVSPRLKALAAYGAARAQQWVEGPDASLPAFQALLNNYGDEFSDRRIPYRLVLALDSNGLPDRLFPSWTQVLSQYYQRVIAGDWELSADKANSSLEEIEARLKLGLGARPESEFLDHLALARAAAAQMRGRLVVKPGEEVRSLQITQGDRIRQLFYRLHPGIAGQQVIVGFSASAAYIQDTLLRTSLAALPATSKVDGNIEDVYGGVEKEGTADDLYVPLKGSLSSWWLHIPTTTIQTSEIAAHREVWFLGLAAVMFLCILSIGVFLLIKVSSDIHWFQLRSDFVSGVSHELKTPLSLIRLYSETLADGEQNYPPEERHSYIRIIARESERLSHLIDNILDFSKVERGLTRTEMHEADLTPTVKQTVDDYSEYLFLRGFTVKMGIQPSLPPVKFNQEQVSQMVLNLLDNARKFSDKSRVIRVNMWREKDEVVLEVQDHGYGIPAAEQEKIFEPFFRVSRGNEKGGCGLGLYLVRDVIQGHGGRIEVFSEVGKGSRFRLYFPVIAAARGNFKPSVDTDRGRLYKQAEI